MQAALMTNETDESLTPHEKRLAEAKRFLNNGARKTAPGNYEIPRVVFDPTNNDHLRSYKTFLETGKWGDIQFHLELPLTSVTETVYRKFTAFALEKLLK